MQEQHLMKKLAFFAILIIIAYNMAVEIDDVYNPSDSGDMMFLNYRITNYKALHGDIKSKWKMLAYHQYNDDLQHDGRETANLISEIIKNGYGGLKNGGDQIVIDLINECSRKRHINPNDVRHLFDSIKSQGGGLTENGEKIEIKWKGNDYKECKYKIE